MRAGPKDGFLAADSSVADFLHALRERGIQVKQMARHAGPADAIAPSQAVVVSPRSEWGVIQTLRLLNQHNLYTRSPSVGSGSDAYQREHAPPGITVDLSNMTGRSIRDDILYLEPGCILGQVVYLLARRAKAVPHGDEFGTSAGGHFLTAGWDPVLTRRDGLGCQSIVSGRVILWDGTVVEATEKSHRMLLHAMRGGAASGVGIVTEIRLRLQEEPAQVTWRSTRITKELMQTVCVPHRAFHSAVNLPREVSASFRFQFEPGRESPSCFFSILSLCSYDETVRHLRRTLGMEVADLVEGRRTDWRETPLMGLRMLPASRFLAANPNMLAEATAQALYENPQLYWQDGWHARSMARSRVASTSGWVRPSCEPMLPALYAAFESAASHPCHKGMVAQVIAGGGRMLELPCAVPLGKAMARFDIYWDEPEQEAWARSMTGQMEGIIRGQADPGVAGPSRGSIWSATQVGDPTLDDVRTKYETRSSAQQHARGEET